MTRGECTHVIDFDPIHCGPGSLLVSHPSQTEQFDVQSAWDGWLVLFRPAFLFSIGDGRERVTAELKLIALLAGLPVHLRLAEPEFKVVRGVPERMHEDNPDRPTAARSQCVAASSAVCAALAPGAGAAPARGGPAGGGAG